MVEYPVKFVSQPSADKCWAASTAMLVNYRDSSSKSANDIAAEGGFVGEGGVTEIELENIARTFKLTQVYPQCADAEGWESILRENGPVMAAVAGNTSEHIIVVSGADAVAAQVYVLDPWHGEGWSPIADFQAKYDTTGQRWSRVTYKT